MQDIIVIARDIEFCVCMCVCTFASMCVCVCATMYYRDGVPPAATCPLVAGAGHPDSGGHC